MYVMQTMIFIQKISFNATYKARLKDLNFSFRFLIPVYNVSNEYLHTVLKQ